MWKDTTECCALWQSINQVHFADGSIDYLGIIVYHDNDIANGTYSTVGTIIRQGQIFNRSGTGGNVTGDHMHLETGKGQVNLSDYKYHFLDSTSCKRIVPDSALFVNDTFVTAKVQYNWITYQGSGGSGLLYRTGTYGNYWGNSYDTSNQLTLAQMQINAQYLYRALTQAGWTLNAIAGVLRKYANRKFYKSTEDGKAIL